MSKNIFFEEVAYKNNIYKVLVTENLKNADFVVVNDVTTIQEELNNTYCDKDVITLINEEGIYRLRGKKDTIKDICKAYYKQMKKYIRIKSKNTYFIEYNRGFGKWCVWVTEKPFCADYVVVNDTTAIATELNNAGCNIDIINKIKTIGIYNLKNGEIITENNIKKYYYNEMKKYLNGLVCEN